MTHPPGMALPRTACNMNEAEEAMAVSEKNLLRNSLVLYTNFQFSEINGRNNRTYIR